MDALRTHEVRLQDGELVLRPLTEGDWDILLSWINDPEILRWADDSVSFYDLGLLQAVYRLVSEEAYCFMIEHAGRPIGDCWVQRMNLDRIAKRHPGRDVRRVDLQIGAKELWGRGIGTAVIRLLCRFAFEDGADAVYGCDVDGENVRSLRAFEKAGFEVEETIPHPPSGKAQVRIDLALSRGRFRALVHSKP